MFKMIKLFFKFVFFVIFLIVTLIVAGNFQIIHSKSGFHILERESWGFSNFYVNTTDWNAIDFAKHPRIAGKLVKDRFEAVFQDTSDTVKQWWNDVSKDRNLPEIEKIKSEFDKTLSDLNRRLNKEDIDLDTYKKKLKELKKATEKKIDAILEALEEK